MGLSMKQRGMLALLYTLIHLSVVITHYISGPDSQANESFCVRSRLNLPILY